MADFRLPGPADGSRQHAIVDDGTLMRRVGGVPGSVRGAIATLADVADNWTLLRRAACVKQAAERAEGRVPAAVMRETGEAVDALLAGLLPGLLMMIALLGVSVGIGGAAGAAIGFLAGGVGAAPGAVIGAKAGASVGIWLLTWLGLGFLAVEIGRGLVELGGRCLDAVRIAWDAHGQTDREARIDRAADGMADAVALLLKLILMAIVARLTWSQAGAAGRSAAASADEMVALLRSSRLGAGFADWVAANSARLIRNPKLQMHRQVQGTQATSEAATPSQLRKASSQEPSVASAATSPKPAVIESITYNGMNGPGPLGPKIANTFRSGTYTQRTTTEPTTLYRVWGGKAGELGPYWTSTPPAGPYQAMVDSALLPSWGNTMTQVTTIRVPPGTVIFEGVAAPQGALVGGGSQVVIPRVDPSWVMR